MTTREDEKLAAEDKNCERQRQSEEIGRQVLRGLGRPEAFRTVDVRPLWANWYRANVLVGQDAASVKVAHSYFLRADGDGRIIQSSPPIMRVYAAEFRSLVNLRLPAPQSCDGPP